VYHLGQSQTKLVPNEWHIPPFLHGLFKQGFVGNGAGLS
jgi:hypothetical protein